MAKTAILAIKIVADARDAAKALDDTAGKTSKMSKGVAVAGAAAAAGLGLLAAGALAAAKAAAQDAKGQALLATALKNSAGASDDAIASTEDWITAQGRALGVADDDLRPALATLARATGDVAKAQQAAALAMDISAATGKDLGTVSAALAKGYGGNTGALGKLVPGLDKGVLATKDMTKITAELARLTGGSAATAAETASGQYERMQLALSETTEGIGAALLPALSSLAAIMLTVAQWAQENTTVFLILGGVLAVVAAAVLAVSVAQKVYAAGTVIVSAATKAWAATQWLLNAALTANPIGLVIAAIALLIGGLVLAYNKSDTFRAIVQGAFAAVLAAVRTVIDWIGPKLSAAWTVVQAVARVVIAAISLYINAWITVLTTVWSWLSEKVPAAFEALKRVATPIIDAIKRAFDGVMAVLQPIIDAIKRIIDLISQIKMPSFDLPDWLPGDQGRSAARGTSVALAPALAGRAALGSTSLVAHGVSRRSSSTSGMTVNVYGAVDPQGTARAVQRLVHNADIRTGRRRLA